MAPNEKEKKGLAIAPALIAASLYLLIAIIMTQRVEAVDKFKTGDRIAVTVRSLNVRSAAGTSAKIVGGQSAGAKGIVLSGPVSASGYAWWLIDYDNGLKGWSADAYLTLSTGSKAPAAQAVTKATATVRTLLWGAYAGSDPDGLARLEEQVGKKADMRAIFVGWNDPFPDSNEVDLQTGQTLLIFWEPYLTSVSSIASGTSDAYIKQFASDAKDFGRPVILIPFPEMNGNWEPWGGYDENGDILNKPQTIIVAWRHIHDQFSAAKNVKFGWAINNDSIPNIAANAASAYYPGNQYVDYVGVDGFNFGQPWESFSQVFDKSLSALTVYKKPIYIFSTASISGTGKADWIKDGLGIQAKKYPSLVGWVWFNQNGQDGNWLIDSDPASLSAFRSILP